MIRVELVKIIIDEQNNDQADVLREVYFRADRPNGVLVFEVPDVAAARAAIDGLPLVAAGLIDFDLVPLRPYPGFARLFREG